LTSVSEDVRVAGRLFPPGAARSEPAELVLSAEGGVRLFAGALTGEVRPVDITNAAVSPRVGRVPRRITLASGEIFETSDNDGVDALLQAVGRRGRSTVHRWERFHPRLVAVVVLVVLLSGALLRFGVPAAADLALTLVPHSVDAAVGEHALATLDQVAFRPSRMTAAETEPVNRVFEELVAAAGLDPAETRLVFRGGGALGANAFALPGGIVVVTDEMLAKAPDTDALAGVLAHELGHVEERHGMRRVLRAAGLGGATLVIFGDPGAVLDEMTGFAALALDLSYSRGFEADADDRAAEILTATGRSPDDLARLLEALTGDGETAGLRWLSTHPSLADRVDRLRTAPAVD
jgi:Zn-dependent protease with chaperone function